MKCRFLSAFYNMVILYDGLRNLLTLYVVISLIEKCCTTTCGRS